MRPAADIAQRLEKVACSVLFGFNTINSFFLLAVGKQISGGRFFYDFICFIDAVVRIEIGNNYLPHSPMADGLEHNRKAG